jgi:hypothetical protein
MDAKASAELPAFSPEVATLIAVSNVLGQVLTGETDRGVIPFLLGFGEGEVHAVIPLENRTITLEH